MRARLAAIALAAILIAWYCWQISGETNTAGHAAQAIAAMLG
jgi:hypothetical protein